MNEFEIAILTTARLMYHKHGLGDFVYTLEHLDTKKRKKVFVMANSKLDAHCKVKKNNPDWEIIGFST